MNSTINNLHLTKNKQGYIALTTVLILGAIGTLLATTMLLVGTLQTQTIQNNSDGINAKVYATSCTEEALKEIRLSTSYTGTENHNFTNGACNFTVTNLGGQNRRIEATGVSGSSTKRMLVIIDNINPDINTITFSEVENF